MAIKFTSTHTKISTTFDFFEDSPEFTQYMIETYVNTNKCLEWRKVDFPNAKTMVITSTWSDTASYLEALSDPILIKNVEERNNYYMFDCNFEIELSTSITRD